MFGIKYSNDQNQKSYSWDTSDEWKQVETDLPPDEIWFETVN